MASNKTFIRAHSPLHVLANTSGLGPDHTVSGLIQGTTLMASGLGYNLTNAAFMGPVVVQGTEPPSSTGVLWLDSSSATPSVFNIVNITTRTSSYTVSDTDVVVLCDGTFTVYLPSALNIEGKLYHIKNKGLGIITIDPFSSETIDGGLTAILSVQYESVVLVSDGSNWHIL